MFWPGQECRDADARPGGQPNVPVHFFVPWAGNLRLVLFGFGHGFGLLVLYSTLTIRTNSALGVPLYYSNYIIYASCIALRSMFPYPVPGRPAGQQTEQVVFVLILYGRVGVPVQLELLSVEHKSFLSSNML